MPEPAGRQVAIATPHTAATEVGAGAFRAGGNAVDAALAAACALTVVYPHMCALGGDVMALVHDGTAHAINGSGRAPRAHPGPPQPQRGVGAITVPGAVAAWQVMADRWGRRPLAAALEAGTRLALDGVAVAPSLAAALAAEPALITGDAGLSAVFAPGGRLLAESDLLVQERLGRTLERLASAGVDDFYAGQTARALISGLSQLGCPITLDDLARHRTVVEPALERSTFGRTIMTMGANSQGFSLIQILAALERLEVGDPLGDGAPMLAALFRESAADRDAHLGDPDAMEVAISALISDDHIDQLVSRARGDGRRAVAAKPAARGDTVAVVALDERLAVSLIQSVFDSFGAGVLEPRTGVLLHNRGACFSDDPDSPNVAAAGKRPLHTLMPLVVTTDRHPSWVAGTMGGHAQAQIHAQLLLRHMAGRDASAAVGLPRFVTGTLGAGGREVHVEEDFASALAAFERVGERVILLPSRSEAVGHSQAIAVSADGALDAGSDPRADGQAIAL